MELSVILKETRQKAFLTQEAFAKELNVTASTINRWEHSKARPNLSAMKLLKQFCISNELNYEQIETEWFKSQRSR